MGTRARCRPRGSVSRGCPHWATHDEGNPMVHERVLVGMLALALGAWGCDSDSGDGSAGAGGTGGSAGSAGSGGTAGSGGASGMGGNGGTGGGGITTKCNEDPDLSTATSVEFPARFWDCYDTADTDIGPSVESCLQEPPPLSSDCAGCYGDYAECIDTDCGESCNGRGANTAACSQCLLTGCNIALTSCTGVASPAVQPQSNP